MGSEQLSICPLKFECPDEIECGYAQTISIIRSLQPDHPFNQTLTTLKELVDHCDPPDLQKQPNNVTVTKPNSLETL